ncbi:unnamed protein product [Cunninghamella blakesleeana]
MELPNYTTALINAPPTYDEVTYSESIWPRNYNRSTPRINLAKFYHEVVLNSHQCIPIQEDTENDINDYHRDIKPSHDNSDDDTMTIESNHSTPLTFEHPHQYSISELNHILTQSRSTSHTLPSYKSFKQLVNTRNFFPIPNKKYQSS